MMVLQAAKEVEGIRLWWHKIAHFGTVDKAGPGHTVRFTHLLCFWRDDISSDTAVAVAGNLTKRRKLDADQLDDGGMIPDVVFRGSKPRLKHSAPCMGVHVIQLAMKWLKRRVRGINLVIDPFCGAGTVLAIANAMGLDALGVDICPKRCRQAVTVNGTALLKDADRRMGS
eukprot:gnl/TRDRNA2_/TRDRNA2_174764_c18_seq1.p1 gnl/TRDRNA2_/TRDRNA2_174764_c18~~gnl/TRDRNA2_/TRDRNA2_174764_c18_seq1.p1  ORF type:complete len:171 (+),score=30.38 gnl/TRDRNA2_/TRDRNA2_174764_c18_seq1:230-742(+)